MLGVLGTVILACVTVVAFQYNKLPFIKNTDDYAAYFSEAGGIKPGNAVRVSGMGVGRVSDLRLEGTKVRIGFTVRKGVVLGDRTEAAIKTETILGAKMLELTPRGDGRLSGVIPLERTTSPYDLPDALGDLTTTISGLDTTQLSAALTTLADPLKATPENLKPALQGVARFSDTLKAATRSCAACWATPITSRRCWAGAASRSPGWWPTPTRCWPRCWTNGIRWTR